MKTKMQHAYSQYSIGDFDKFDCLKLSSLVYLNLFFVLRGYLAWLMSVTNMRDSVSFILWIYPSKSLFYMSLFSGLLGLFVVLIISLRRPNAANWVKICWRHCRSIIILALLFDFSISLLGYFYWQLVSVNWLVLQAALVSVLVILCFKNKRFTLNLQEFPQLLPEK
jgi:hypothetical protein